MREIKFRAWDKWSKPQRMVYPHNGDFIGWHSPSNWKDCYDVMQFTGLKDKNGNEIYEGDVVMVRGTKRVGEYVTEIVWHGLGFQLKENKTYLKDGSLVSGMVEVIGNIYEHENLLTNGNKEQKG